MASKYELLYIMTQGCKEMNGYVYQLQRATCGQNTET